MRIRLLLALGTVVVATTAAVPPAGAERRGFLDVAAPVFRDSQSGRRAGAGADRFELDDAGRMAGLSAWYHLSYVVGSDRIQVHDHNSATTTGADTDIARSERVAWQVAASIAGGAGPGQLPGWARPRTGVADGTSAGLLFALADVDLLTDGRLAADLRVAATGTIGFDGSVTPVRMVDAKVAAASLAGADVVFAPDFPAGMGPVTRVSSHVGDPTPGRTVGDWLNTTGFEAAGRKAASGTRAGLVLGPVDDVRQAVAWLCGRTGLRPTCRLARTAASVPLASARPYSVSSRAGARATAEVDLQ